MAQTKFVFEGFAPFTNDSRLSEFSRAIAAVFDAHRVTGFFVTQTGPYPDGYIERIFPHGPNSRTRTDARPDGGGGDQRSERARLAAEDFGGPGPVEQVHNPEPGPEVGGDRRDGHEDGDGAGEPVRKRKPRSDAGKPRGPRGGAASGSAAEGRRDGQHAEGRDASERDGDGTASRGGREGVGPGEGADGRSGRGVGRPGDHHDRDAEAAPVSAKDEDWSGRGNARAASDDLWSKREPEVDPADLRKDADYGENGEEWCAKAPDLEWPDSLTPEKVDRTVLSGIMSDHYRAHGGKFRDVTFDLLFEACQADDIASVPEKDLRRVAKVFLKDTARYKYGLQPQPTKAPAR
jgi:hypothetical protein